ncbi:hypothetical protein X777_16182 [Ooceraea biroi]|uniref:Uncharacterized protein n=1 Tax=Ooceraea biroi TaxID=2015173 RepID=A0A026WXV7_OOCBI|nr:hypothetical protein X777_16182 [Ooceraea biroi]
MFVLKNKLVVSFKWQALFLHHLLQPQVPWHVLLAANSAQSLAASESLGRPSCRFQVGAKYLQVEDTCKSKHLGEEARRREIYTMSQSLRITNISVIDNVQRSVAHDGDDSEKLVRRINIWSAFDAMFQLYGMARSCRFRKRITWRLEYRSLRFNMTGMFFPRQYLRVDSFTIYFDVDSLHNHISVCFEGRKSRAQGGSRFPFSGTGSRSSPPFLSSSSSSLGFVSPVPGVPSGSPYAVPRNAGSQGSKWQDGGPREKERRRGDHLGGAFGGVRCAPRVPVKPTPKKRKEAGRGEQKSGEGRVKVEKEGEERERGRRTVTSSSSTSSSSSSSSEAEVERDKKRTVLGGAGRGCVADEEGEEDREVEASLYGERENEYEKHARERRENPGRERERTRALFSRVPGFSMGGVKTLRLRQ